MKGGLCPLRKENEMAYQFIETSFQDHVLRLTFNRPPLNVLNIAMMEEINDFLSKSKDTEGMRALLIDAKNKCFSAGVDVGEHMGDLAPKMIEVFHRMFRILYTYEVPVVASVYGSCLGGGCEVAAFCDFIVASEDAKFGQPEIQVGVFPPIAALIFPRMLNRKDALELILTGKVISAEEALKIGLINKVVPRDRLEEETQNYLKAFTGLSGIVLKKTKKAIFAGLCDDFEKYLKIIEDIYLKELMATEDANEGLKAFLEKRKPTWQDK